MRCLLVMPRFTSSPDDPYFLPMGIAYISASLKYAGYEVHTLNLNATAATIDEAVSDAIARIGPDVLCTGGQSPNYVQIKGILSLAKQINPAIRTVVGGGLVSSQPEIIMEGIRDADIGVINEGEFSIVEIAATLSSGSSLGAVDGIIYRENGVVVRTKPRRDIEDLDALPFPDYEGFGYSPAINGAALVSTSRSCPFDCSFCFHTCGKTYRKRSLDNVFAEIDYLVEKFQISAVGILDELFSVDKNRLEEFCERIEPYGLTWGCQLRVDGMKRGILEKVLRSGCNTLSVGIESASDRVLRSMDKKITIAQVDKAVEVAKEAGVNLLGNLLFGDKEDDMESVLEDLRWFEAHPEMNIGFFRTMVLPGSKLYKHAVETGRITDEIKYLEDGNFTINVTKLDDAEYGKCLDIIDQATLLREYPANEIRLEGLDKRAKKAIVSCECPACGTHLRHRASDFLGLENFICDACGQNYNVNLFRVAGDIVLGKIRDILREKKIVVWGMGTAGRKFLHFCESASNGNLLAVDRNPGVQGKTYGGGVVAAPESLAGDIEHVLFGTSFMGKSGEAVPNSHAIATIKKAALSLLVRIGSMSSVDAFIFETLNDSGLYKSVEDGNVE